MSSFLEELRRTESVLVELKNGWRLDLMLDKFSIDYLLKYQGREDTTIVVSIDDSTAEVKFQASDIASVKRGKRDG